MDKSFNLNVKYGILGFNDWITGINSPKKKLDYIEACFERLDFFLEKSNSFMSKDTLLRLIASVERYYLEYEHADSVLRSRIKKYPGTKRESECQCIQLYFYQRIDLRSSLQSNSSLCRRCGICYAGAFESPDLLLFCKC